MVRKVVAVGWKRQVEMVPDPPPALLEAAPPPPQARMIRSAPAGISSSTSFSALEKIVPS